MEGHKQILAGDGAAALAGDGAAALGWLVMAGVDVGVDDLPRNWLAPAKRRAEASLRAGAAQQAAATTASTAARPAPRASAGAVNPVFAASTIDAATLESLAAAIAAFAHPLRRADLAPQLVTGNAGTGVMIVCEQPEPDGTPAAILRDRMLAAIGLDRGNCALIHRLPWPTTGGRTPRADELAAFGPYVTRALELTRPRHLRGLGQGAAALAGDAMGLASARGRWADVNITGLAIPLLATCHPRLLLAQPLRKREAWADLQTFARSLIEPE